MLSYRAAIDLSPQTLNYVAGMIRRHRKAIGSVWWRLNPGQQALWSWAKVSLGLLPNAFSRQPGSVWTIMSGAG
ncbi:hypothetical protein [Nonomuraea zeae]|uniref:Transposase n=1 Tax=Nonomuraea zeae TaxID=1642303 RepID=A0A5S4G5C1_9ACTN|nr:hypothetical protein ETD85_37115 [Nonomuraea zeae]